MASGASRWRLLTVGAGVTAAVVAAYLARCFRRRRLFKGPIADVLAWECPYTPGPLSKEEMRQFFQDGFVIKRGLLSPADIDGAKKSVQGLLDSLAERLYNAGKIKSLHKDVGLDERLCRLDEEFEHANVLLHKNGVLAKGISDVWTSAPMIAIAKQILGGNFGGHPVWNLRCKTPEPLSVGQSTVPWHQDNSYLDPSCWDQLQLTAWVPLVRATKQNGCMQMMRGGHLSGKTVQHSCCVGGTWYNEMDLQAATEVFGAGPVGDIVTCEMEAGDVLFLNNIIPHRSLPNTTAGTRWSLDLRWQRSQEPNGFCGIKDNIEMVRDGKLLDIDWSTWANVDRNAGQMEHLKQDESAAGRAAVKAVQEAKKEDDFDTVICGPWMTTWPLVHHNRHVERFLETNTKPLA